MSIITFTAKVIPGLGKGKKLGFATANLRMPDNFALDFGVYAASVSLGGKKYMGALHFGKRKILEKELGPDAKDWLSLEVHILNFDQAIGGQEISLTVLKKIRPVLEFGSWEDLKKQIKVDVEETRRALNNDQI